MKLKPSSQNQHPQAASAGLYYLIFFRAHVVITCCIIISDGQYVSLRHALTFSNFNTINFVLLTHARITPVFDAELCLRACHVACSKIHFHDAYTYAHTMSSFTHARVPITVITNFRSRRYALGHCRLYHYSYRHSMSSKHVLHRGYSGVSTLCPTASSNCCRETYDPPSASTI